MDYKLELPKLREELQLHGGKRDRDGSPTWIVYDPPANRFYHIGWLEFEILSRWHLGDPDEIIAAVIRETSLRPSMDDLQHVLIFLRNNQLIKDSSPQGTALFQSWSKSQQVSMTTWLIHNYLFFRIPILHPDAFLSKLYTWGKRYVNRSLFWILVALGLTGFYLVIRQWDLFTKTFVNTLTPSGFLGYGVMLIFAKAAHELGHACVAKHYGIRVPRMGVAFLVMFPVLYTDTAESWFLTNHRQRLFISMAGILAETGIAIVALFLWGITSPGVVRDLFYFLSVVSLFRTLLVNSSPFLRFDGYYILSDLLDLPNLQPRAFALARHDLRKKVLGLDTPAPESFSKHLTMFLIVYSWATWIYRLVVFTGIALAVYHYFFKVLGIIAFGIEITFFVSMPIIRELKVWIEAYPMISFNRKRVLGLLITILIVLCLAPIRSTVMAPAFMGAYEKWQIYSPYSAKVVKATADGTKVRKGDVLFILDAHEQRHQASIAEQQAGELRDRVRRLSASSDIGRERSASWLSEAHVREQESVSQKHELKRLVMRAETDGVLLDVDEGVKAGVHVTSRDLLGLLVGPSKSVVDAFVSEHDLKRIHLGSPCVFWPSLQYAGRQAGRIISIGRNRLTTLPLQALADKAGGEIATVNSSQNQLVPVDALYRVRIELTGNVPIESLQMGRVVIRGDRESLVGRFLSYATSVIIRESGF